MKKRRFGRSIQLVLVTLAILCACFYVIMQLWAGLALAQILVVGYFSEIKVSYPTKHALSDTARNALEAKWGMSLPVDAGLLAEGNGGGGDPSYKYYYWVIVSREHIRFPVASKNANGENTSLPLDDAVEALVSVIGTLPMKPQSAYSSDWRIGNLGLRGTLVRADGCDYLMIEQFKNVNP